jgi:hypothetical protein
MNINNDIDKSINLFNDTLLDVLSDIVSKVVKYNKKNRDANIFLLNFAQVSTDLNPYKDIIGFNPGAFDKMGLRENILGYFLTMEKNDFTEYEFIIEIDELYEKYFEDLLAKFFSNIIAGKGSPYEIFSDVYPEYSDNRELIIDLINGITANFELNTKSTFQLFGILLRIMFYKEKHNPFKDICQKHIKLISI